MKKKYPALFFYRKSFNLTLVIYSLLIVVVTFFAPHVNGQTKATFAPAYKSAQGSSNQQITTPANEVKQNENTVKGTVSSEPDWTKNNKQGQGGTQGQGDGVPHLSKKWGANPFDQKVFIENQGQFDGNIKGSKKILYQALLSGVKTYFTQSGIVYTFDEVMMPEKGKGKEDEDDKAKDIKHTLHCLNVTWAGCNPNATITAENPNIGQYGYTIKNNISIKANTYGKLVYHDIYPGIDIEYTIPKDKIAIEYTVIAHPGADISKLKIVYDGLKDLSIGDSSILHVNTEKMGTFRETAPIGFYQDNNGKVEVNATINGNEESFTFPKSYDNTKTLVIDPTFSVDPLLTAGGYDAAYDCDFDNKGNVYVYGGYNPFQLSKFNSSGTWQWTYTTNSATFDPFYYGDFATDKATGTCYITEGNYYVGIGAKALKVSNNTLMATFPGSNSMREMWRACYNRCTGQVVIGGGGTNAPSGQAAMLDTNMSAIVPVNPLGTPQAYWDVDRLVVDPAGSPAYMAISASSDLVYNYGWTPSQLNILMSVPVPALNPASYINQPSQNSGGGYDNLFEVNSILYMGPGVYGGSATTNGMNGMAATSSWLYMYDGYRLTRHAKASGAYNSSVLVSGYNSNYFGAGETDVYWGGLDADACDNLYVGSGTNILVYNTSLAYTGTSFGMPNNIYDIVLGANDAVIFSCGNGFVEAINNTNITVNASTVVSPTTCGLSNGSATANLTICGSAPGGVSYSWSPGGQATQTATGLAAGTYTVTMSFGCGESFTATAVIGASSPPVAPSLGSNSPICAGQTLNLTSSSAGATSYNWTGPNAFSSGAQNPSIAGATTAASGTYTCTASAAGCTSGPSTISVTVNASPATPTLGSNSPICAGSTLNLTASSAGATSYSWTGPNAFASGSQNPSIVGATTAASGTYSCTATGPGGCTSTIATIAVTVNAIPAAPTLGSNSPICAGATLNLTATSAGATGYTWTGPNAFASGVQNPSIIGATTAASGTYSVTATKAGCTSPQATITVVVNPVPPAPTVGSNSPICAGATLNLTATSAGATGYSWTGPNAFASGVQNPSIVGATTAASGTYTVTASAAGCTSSQATIAVVVNATPPAPTLGSNSPICAGSTLNLTATSAGATSYSWTGPNAFVSGSQNPSIAGATTAATGTYTCTATGPGGCTSAIATIAITVNAIPAAPTTGSNSPICAGATLNLTATSAGATGYSWTGPNAFASGVQNPSIVGATTAASGTYTVTANKAGCTSPQATITVVVNPVPPAPTLGSNSPICAGSTLNLTATSAGATGYSWTGPNAFVSAAQNPSIPGATTAASGTYTCTATGPGGCSSAIATIVVTVNPIPAAPTTGSNSPICAGSTLNLTATSAGATSYSWTGPNAFVSAVQNPSIAGATTAASGTYTVTAKAAGCTSPVGTITVVVNPIPTLTVSPASPTICPGGNVNLTGSGASTYTWSPATNLSATTGAVVNASPGSTTTYTVTGTSAGCPSAPVSVVVNVAASLAVTINPITPSICTGGAGVTLNGNGAATYTWKASAGLSCTNCASTIANPLTTTTYTVYGASGGCSDSAKVTVTVNPTPTVNINITGISAAICPGDSLGLIGSGASTYAWTPATGVACTSCATTNVSPAVTTTYTLTGTNAGGCSSTATQVVTVYPKPVISVSLTKPTICAGDTVYLNASGGASYTWAPGTGLNTTVGASVIANPSTTATYTVSAKGVGGCPAKDSVIITVLPKPVVTVTPPTPAVCKGDSIALTANGAANYVWSPSTGLTVTTGNITTAFPGSTSTYTVIGTSAGGCNDTITTIVKVNPLPVISVNPPTPAICKSDSVTLTAFGATTYVWSPSIGLNTTVGTSVNASPGSTSTYTVTGTDGNGCTSSGSVAISVGTLTVTANASSSTICSGTSSTLTASGAVTYTWKPGTGLSATTGTSVTANPVTSITYTVIGSSGGGCSDSNTVAITVNATPTLSVMAGSPTICFGASGTTITASGATTYSWSPGTGLSSTTDSIVNANAGSTQTYTVTGTSSLGCPSSSTVTIAVDQPKVTASASSPSICFGSTGTSINASGASNYIWTPAVGLSATTGSSVTANPDSSLSYKVVGVDALGCADSANVAITVNSLPVITVSANDTSLCTGNSAIITAGGANNYTWLPVTGLVPSTGAVVTATPSGTVTYTVTGTSAAGCSSSAPITITVNSSPVISILLSGGSVLCPGQSVTMTASGAAVYTWSPSTGLSTTTGASVSATPPTSPMTYKVVGVNGACSDSATQTLTLYPALTATSSTDTICASRNTTVSVTASGGNPGYTYAWTPPVGTGSGPYVVNPGTTTTYSCIVTDGCGSTATGSALVYTKPSPKSIFFPTPDTIAGGQYVSFVDSSTNATSWYWTFGDGGNSTTVYPLYQYLATGKYLVTLVTSNGFGCWDTASDTVYVTEGIFIPNVFTPNNDGQNDVFHVKAGGMKEYHIEIFNRWGEKVFQADSPEIDWDGRSMTGVQESDGDYYYIIRASDYKGKPFNQNGYVQLIRN